MRIAVCLLVMVLTGCATTPRAPSVSGDPVIATDIAWQQHAEQLGQLQAWRLSGRIGARQDQQAWNAGLEWRQTDDLYEIDLLSPFGSKLAHFSGNEQGVFLTNSKGQTAFAETPEQLMTQLLGFSLPLAGMRYWVRGLPEPGIQHQRLELNKAGRLSQLSQSGWEVDYLQYQSVAGVDLPKRLKMSHEEIGVTLVIKDWAAPVHD